MSLPPLELQDKYKRLGELIGMQGEDSQRIADCRAAMSQRADEIRSLQQELSITYRRQRKIVEKKPRKSRSDKGTKRDSPPEGTQGTTTVGELFPGIEKTREELEAEAKATATCPICKKLLKDCTCQVSEEAAAKHKKSKR